MSELTIVLDEPFHLQQYAKLLTTAELRQALVDLLGFNATNLLRMAVVIAELEQRGENLSDLKIGILPILRDIAAGRILPAVVVQYAGQPWVIQRLTGRPTAEQELALSGVLPPPKNTSPKSVNRQPSDGPRHFAPPSLSAPAGHAAGDGTDGGPDLPPDDRRPVWLQSATAASPRDVGDMVAKMLLESKDCVVAFSQCLRALVESNLIPAAAAEALRPTLRAPKRKPSWEAD